MLQLAPHGRDCVASARNPFCRRMIDKRLHRKKVSAMISTFSKPAASIFSR